MIEQIGVYRAGEVSSSEAIEHWDRAARDFAHFLAEGDEFFHKHAINPCLLELLGDVKGQSVCDLGCGEGHFARGLADHMGRNVDIVCIDASGEMIRIGQERSRGYEDCLRFLVADAADLNALQTASMDTVVCNMALMDIADYHGAIAEVARVLRQGGTFALSILHPCFMTPGSGWIKKDPQSRDPATKVGWKVDHYHDRLVQKTVIKPGMSSETYYFHRTLGDYFLALRRHGLVVVDLREPVPSAEVLADDPGSKPDLKLSMFLVLKAVKGEP